MTEYVERKMFVATWTKEQLESIDKDVNRDFLSESLFLMAERIGLYAIENPGDSIQWVGTKLTENSEAQTVTLYAEVFIRHEGTEEYFKRNPYKPMEEDKEDEREEA